MHRAGPSIAVASDSSRELTLAFIATISVCELTKCMLFFINSLRGPNALEITYRSDRLGLYCSTGWDLIFSIRKPNCILIYCKNLERLPRGSTRVISLSGSNIASTTPGKPAPLPMSARDPWPRKGTTARQSIMWPVMKLSIELAPVKLAILFHSMANSAYLTSDSACLSSRSTLTRSPRLKTNSR